MRSAKPIFRTFLAALTEGSEGRCPSFGEEEAGLYLNMAGGKAAVRSFPQSIGITPDFQVRTSTITNCMEVEREDETVLYATVHHLYAIDENQEIFPFLYGGKYEFIYSWKENAVKRVTFDLEYLSGNTFLVRGKWKPCSGCGRMIRAQGLRDKRRGNHTVKDAVYRFFWALDTMDLALLEENSAADLYVMRAGVDGDFYEMRGIGEAAAFMEKDKQYYSQNQYSIHISRTVYEDESHAGIQAYHLYPANTGNKHLGSWNKYSQFYNEILEIFLEKEAGWRIRSVHIRRKENPVPYGYRVLEL